MKKMVRLLSASGLSIAILIGCGGRLLYAQNTNDPNAAPNPYHMEEFRVQMPDGRKLGAPIGVEIDQSDGKTLWVLRALWRRHLRRFYSRSRHEVGRQRKDPGEFRGRSGQLAAWFLCRSSR